MSTGEFNAGGVTLRGNPASYPWGSRSTHSRFMLRKLELSAGLMDHLARKQTLPYQWSVAQTDADPKEEDIKCTHLNACHIMFCWIIPWHLCPSPLYPGVP